MADTKRADTLTLAPDLFSLEPGMTMRPPAEMDQPSLEQVSLVFSPEHPGLSLPDRPASEPLEPVYPTEGADALTSFWSMYSTSPVSSSMSPPSMLSPSLSQASTVNTPHSLHSKEEGLAPMVDSGIPIPAESMSPLTQAYAAPEARPAKDMEGRYSSGLDYDSVCSSLKEMAATGTPATAMMQFLNLSRQALHREIPADVVLQGLLEREKRQALEPSTPSSSSAFSSSPGSMGKRRPRQSLKEVAKPYAIPAGPRMYQCDQCPLIFNRAYNLKEHLKLHDGHAEKRFSCPLLDCPHASHRRADMHRHIKSVHLKHGLDETAKAVILVQYPAMRPDLYPDESVLPALSSSDEGWGHTFKSE